MSVPVTILLIFLSIMERVESYILSLSNFFYKPGHRTLIIAFNDKKAVLPALDSRYKNIPAGTYKYELNVSS